MVKINGISEIEKRLKRITKGRKEQRQVVMKHKSNIYTEAGNFGLKIECE